VGCRHHLHYLTSRCTASPQALKATTAANAKGYCFLNGRGMYLDPTDEKGQVSQQPRPGTPWPFPVDVTLAFINEPNAGQAICNVVRPKESLGCYWPPLVGARWDVECK
jgi:hypothetical protein